MPGAFEDMWVSYKSENPFMAISKGDIINPSVWPDSQSPMEVLRVVNVEHIIWDVPNTNQIKHKICVYTQEVEGTAELRTQPQ